MRLSSTKKENRRAWGQGGFQKAPISIDTQYFPPNPAVYAMACWFLNGGTAITIMAIHAFQLAGGGHA